MKKFFYFFTFGGLKSLGKNGLVSQKIFCKFLTPTPPFYKSGFRGILAPKKKERGGGGLIPLKLFTFFFLIGKKGTRKKKIFRKVIHFCLFSKNFF